MTTLKSELDNRREEFDGHFALAKALEDRMMLEDDSSIGSIVLSSRHINTVKSGLIVHLYNIEEAILTQALHFLGSALGEVEPRKWTSHSMSEWLRESLVSRITDGEEDTRVGTAFKNLSPMLTLAPLGPQKLKKPRGSWDDKVIATFMNRVNMKLRLSEDMHRRTQKFPHYGDKTPLEFLAKRRNAIAHGLRSFEEGANDLQLSDIRTLADTVLDYIEHVAKAFEDHVNNAAHLIPVDQR